MQVHQTLPWGRGWLMRLGVWADRRCTFFDSEFFSGEQYSTVDQWQDILTQRSLSAACKITATFQVDKDL